VYYFTFTFTYVFTNSDSRCSGKHDTFILLSLLRNVTQVVCCRRWAGFSRLRSRSARLRRQVLYWGGQLGLSRQ